MNEFAVAVREATEVASGPLSVTEVVGQVQRIQQVMKTVMKEGVHYGKIPGTNKDTLFKPGAELLAMTFRIAPQYSIEDLSDGDQIRYRIKCTGTHQPTGIRMGEGVGEASSNEEKYRWRKASGRAEYEGAPADRKRIKHGYNSQERREYQIQQVRVEPADIANTVLKMAAKRAQIAMTLTVLAAGDCFAQDLEDMPDELRGIAGDDPPPRAPASEVRAPRPRQQPAQGSAPPGLIPEGPLGVLRTQLAQLGGEDAMDEFRAKFGIADASELPVSRINEALEWVRKKKDGEA